MGIASSNEALSRISRTFSKRFTFSKKRTRSAQHQGNVYVALFDFEADSNTEEISFRKGDLMELIDDKYEDDWRQAQHLTSNVTGFVPLAYIAKKGSLQSRA